MNKDHKVSFRLNDALYTLLMRYCTRTGSRPSVVLREALEAFLLKLE